MFRFVIPENIDVHFLLDALRKTSKYISNVQSYSVLYGFEYTFLQFLLLISYTNLNFLKSSLCNKMQWNKYFYKNHASLRCNKQSDEQTGKHVLIDFSVDAELENMRVYSL